MRERLPCGCIASVVLCFLASNGCEERARVNRISAPDQQLDYSSERRIVRDLGIVRPSSVNDFVVTVENCSDYSWYLSAIDSPCKCTVLRPHTDFVPAHGSLPISISYTAPQQPIDDSRHIGLRFRGPDDPAVSISIRCKVRSPLHIDHRRIDFGQLGPDHSAQVAFHVENYENRSWDGIEFVGPPKWLFYRISEIGHPPEGASQAWRVVVWVQPELGTRLVVRDFPIELRAVVREASHSERIFFTVQQQPPLEANPRQLFFGTLTRGTHMCKSIALKFAEDAAPDYPAPIRFSHALGEELAINCATPAAISVTFSPKPDRWNSARRVAIHEQLKVTVADHEIGIPIIAILVPDGTEDANATK